MHIEHTALFSLTGKVALVTGASRGLGQAISLGLAKAGAEVICCASKLGGCQQTIEQITQAGGQAHELAADLADEQAVKQLYQDAKNLVGTIDILVNNGGTISRYPAQQYPLAEFKHVVDVNLSGLFQLCQLMGTDMLSRKCGKIINIASMLSYTGGLTVAAYTASKHAVAGVTKALANEWASSNVQVNAIAPGYFRTDNTQALQDDENRCTEIEKRIPAGQWGEPEQLVGAAVFLASAASDYVNGHILAVDGGWLAR